MAEPDTDPCDLATPEAPPTQRAAEYHGGDTERPAIRRVREMYARRGVEWRERTPEQLAELDRQIAEADQRAAEFYAQQQPAA